MNHKDVDEMIEQPYMYETKKVVSNTSSSGEDSSTSGSDFVDNPIGDTEWCDCQNCKKEKRKIDCLCCLEVAI